MTTETITIYIGQWNDQDFVFSLKREEAMSLVTTCIRFGDPSKDRYAVGNHWAAGDHDAGWRIVERKIAVPVIEVELRTSENDDTSHLVWQCPYCKKWYSDEWRTDDQLPVLLGCGCDDSSKYLLGVSS